MAARSLASVVAGLLVVGVTSGGGKPPAASASAGPDQPLARVVTDVPSFQPGGAMAVAAAGIRYVGLGGGDPDNPYRVLDSGLNPIGTVPTPYLSGDGSRLFDGTALRTVGGGPTTTLPTLPDSYTFDALVGADLSLTGDLVAIGATRPGTDASTIFLTGSALGGTIIDARLLMGTVPSASLREPSVPASRVGIAFTETLGGFACTPSATCFSRVRFTASNDDGFALPSTDVAVTPGQTPSSGRSWAPRVSTDGRYVAFLSDATDLVSAASTPRLRLYRRDMVNATTIVVADDVDGSNTDGYSMNDPGDRFAYVADVDGAETVRVVTAGLAPVDVIGGAPGTPSCTRAPALSNDGQFLLFTHCGGTTALPLGAPSTIGVQRATLPATASTIQFDSAVPARALDSRINEARLAKTSVKHVPIVKESNVASIVGPRGTPAAAVLNVSAVDPDAAGFLTVWPCDQPQPTASNVNYAAHQTIANAVVTGVSAAGEVCVYTHAGTDLVVDVSGTFGPGSSLIAVPPTRLLDTRSSEDAGTPPQTGAGSVTVIHPLTDAGLPADTEAVSLNVTVTKPAAAGFVTVYPCGADLPTASNLNYLAGETIPNAVIVPVAPDGTVCLYTHAAADLIVDINGALPAGSGVHGVTPARLLDTRAGETDTVPNLPGDAVVTVPVAGHGGVPADATSAILNVTVANPAGSGFVTVWPCDAERPEASNVNHVAGQTIPNMVVTRLAGDGSVCLYTKAAADLIVDVNGYLTA